MASLTTRAGKGSPLTNNELDANFNNLNTEVTPARPTIRPSLSLDFANSKSVDSRITFTRASSAMRYDANGVLQKVVNDQPRIDFDPSTGECKGLLVEEQRTNLLCLTNDFVYGWNPYWPRAAQLKPNAAIAPDGTYTATKVYEAAASIGVTSHSLYQGISATNGATYTRSVYAKAGERIYMYMRHYDGVSNTGAVFNLSDGTIPLIESGVTAISTPIGNGWFRCSVTVLCGGTSERWQIQPASSVSVNNYVGDGVSGIYIWGPQLEQGSFATSYIPSTDTFTSRASSASYFDSTGTLRYAGVNQPRYGYGYDTISGKWVSQGLVLEAAATNLVTTSNDTYISGVTVVKTTNYGVAPDGTNTSTRVQFPADNAFVVNYVANGGLTPSATYTASVWVKGTSGQTLTPYSDSNGGATYTYSAPGIVTLTGAWQRISWTHTLSSNNAGLNIVVRSQTSDTAKDIQVWGFQLETGYVATSYIPTYGASATRAADVSSSAQTTRAGDKAVVAGNALTNAINPIEGSLVWSRSRSAVGALPELTLFSDGGGTDFYYKALAWMNTAQSCNVTSLNNSVSQFSQTVTIPTDLSVVTTAFAYAENNMAASINGSSPTTDTVASVQQSVNTLGLAIPGSNNSNQHIRKVVYYPKRLTNAQLQALTA